MTQSTNKFESLLELLINEETEKAEQMFHEIVVEKSRDIYENLADSETATTETKEETKEEDKKEEVKETEKADEKAEDKKEEAKEEVADEKIKDEGVFTKPAPIATRPAIQPVKSDEESIEEIGGDATDDLVKDITSDEEGEADVAADTLGQDMDADGEEGEVQNPEERISDLEDALEDLKAEFEAMMNNGDDAEAEETALAPAMPVSPQPEMARVEGKDKAETKETVKEYKIQKSADKADHSDKSAKSPVNTKVKSAGGTTANIAKGGADDKGRTAPTAGKLAGGFENSPAIDKSKSFSKEVKADTKDGSDKSAKSPVAKVN